VNRYLIDSGPLAAYLNERPAAVSSIQPWVQASEAATSMLVYGEVVEYIKSLSDYPGRLAQLRRVMREILPYFPTYSIMERYADIRRALRPPRGPGLIGDVDTLIAATALELDLTLVTIDNDFDRVEGLRVLKLDLRR
jgi:predicted nucleic acid-binding protein